MPSPRYAIVDSGFRQAPLHPLERGGLEAILKREEYSEGGPTRVFQGRENLFLFSPVPALPAGRPHV